MIIIALDNVRSAYNVGSILRTMDGAFGNNCKLILGGNTPTPENKEVNKTALGAQQNITWESIQDLKQELNKLKEENCQIIGIEECKGSKEFSPKLIKNNSIVIFGAETTGISKEILDICDQILHLPMKGIKNSLNVASTVAAVTYLISYA